MATRTRCARCGRENDPGFAFCRDCGASLKAAPPAAGAACDSCGAALQPGFRFCGTCGKPAEATGDALEGPKGTSPHIARPVRAAARAGRFRLVLRRGDGGPATFPIRGEATCGRREGEIRLADDPTVSPRHLRLREDGGALRAEDLGSVNGTFLRLRAPRALRPGDELRLGHQLLRLEPVPRPAARGDGGRAWGGRDAGCRFRLAQLLEGGGVGEVFPLRDGENVLGRDGGEASFPADRWVSARHARVDVEGDVVTLSDLRSVNGTFVRIAGPVTLAAGDELLVGSRLLRVEQA